MNTGFQNRREQAQAEFQQRVGSAHSADLVRSLWAGLTTLRKLLLTRLHNDVEAYYGIDSILAPMTASETRREMCHAADEIEIYSLTVVLAEAAHSGYAHDDADWFREWLLRLRWGDEMNAMVAERMHLYDQYGDNDRRHMFASFVEQAYPRLRKRHWLFTGFILVQCVLPPPWPLATHCECEVRGEQISFLPVIADCHDCHGLPLENGDICPNCGNPLWKINWLSATA